MPIVRHTDPDAFLAAATPVLAGNAAAGSVFRAMALGLKRRPPAPGEHVYLATWHERGVATATAIQRGEHAVMVEAGEPSLASRFADDLAGLHPQLQGVGGPIAPCEDFARCWRARTSRAHVLRAHLRHHLLTGVADVPPAPGAMRDATDSDLDWLLDATLAFVAEAGMPDSEAQVRRNVPLLHAQGRYRIWDDDGARVAYAGWTDAGDGDARVGPVYSPPAARRRGYATALVAALSREILGQGFRRIFLTTDVANPTSNAIYARIGYRPLSDYYHFDFVSAT